MTVRCCAENGTDDGACVTGGQSCGFLFEIDEMLYPHGVNELSHHEYTNISDKDL